MKEKADGIGRLVEVDGIAPDVVGGRLCGLEEMGWFGSNDWANEEEKCKEWGKVYGLYGWLGPSWGGARASGWSWSVMTASSNLSVKLVGSDSSEA